MHGFIGHTNSIDSSIEAPLHFASIEASNIRRYGADIVDVSYE